MDYYVKLIDGKTTRGEVVMATDRVDDEIEMNPVNKSENEES